MAGVPAAFKNLHLGRRPDQAGTGNLVLARTRPPPPGLGVGAVGSVLPAAFGGAMGAISSVGTSVDNVGAANGMGIGSMGTMGAMAGMLGMGDTSGIADPNAMTAMGSMEAMAAMAAMLNMGGAGAMDALGGTGGMGAAAMGAGGIGAGGICASGSLPDMSNVIPALSTPPVSGSMPDMSSVLSTVPPPAIVPPPPPPAASSSAGRLGGGANAAAISLHDIGMNAGNPLEQQMHHAVREFVLKWDLESSFLKRILLQLRHRPTSWKIDLDSLGEDMKEAKSPPGFLAMKLRQMADGTYVRKGHKLYQGPSGDEVLDEVRKFLDDVKMGDRVDFEKRLVVELKKRDDWKLDLEAIHEEIREAKSPPGLLNAKLHQMNEGIWARKGQKGKRKATSDPMLIGIRAFLDKWDLEDGFEGRIRKQLMNRFNTWREDLEDLSSEINELRYGKNSPAGYISAKLKEMDEGKFIPKRCLPPKKKVPPPPGGYAPANPSPSPERKKSRSRSRKEQRYRSRSRDVGAAEEHRSRSRGERKRDRSRSYSQRRPKSRSRSRSPEAGMSFREFRKKRMEKEKEKESRGGDSRGGGRRSRSREERET